MMNLELDLNENQSGLGVRAWDQQPDETPKSFAAFTVYRDLPLYGEGTNRRSVKNAALKLGVSHKTLDKWSSQHKWVSRAAAYDQWQGTALIEAKQVGLIELQRATQMSLSNQLIIMNEILERKLNEVNTTIQKAPSEVSATELKKLVETVKVKDDLARRLAGLPTVFTTEKVDPTQSDEEIFVIGG